MKRMNVLLFASGAAIASGAFFAPTSANADCGECICEEGYVYVCDEYDVCGCEKLEFDADLVWDLEGEQGDLYIAPLTNTLEANDYSTREVGMVLRLVAVHIADANSATGKEADTFNLHQGNYRAYGFDLGTAQLVSSLMANVYGD